MPREFEYKGVTLSREEIENLKKLLDEILAE